MADVPEIQLKVVNKKKTEEYDDNTVTSKTWKYKFEATNDGADFVDYFKYKGSRDFAAKGDTFSLRELVSQKNLEEVLDDASGEENDATEEE